VVNLVYELNYLVEEVATFLFIIGAIVDNLRKFIPLVGLCCSLNPFCYMFYYRTRLTDKVKKTLLGLSREDHHGDTTLMRHEPNSYTRN